MSKGHSGTFRFVMALFLFYTWATLSENLWIQRIRKKANKVEPWSILFQKYFTSPVDNHVCLQSRCPGHWICKWHHDMHCRADVKVCDQFFWTPLHHAAHAGHLELIELLVEAGAAVDAQALNGGTPLMGAIKSSRPSCVDFLIKAGADVNARNKKGLT